MYSFSIVLAPQGFKVDTLKLLEEQEENHYVLKKRSGRTWFGKSKKKIYTNKLENWETCDVRTLYFTHFTHSLPPEHIRFLTLSGGIEIDHWLNMS